MRRLVTPRWIAVHLAVLVMVVAFLGLGWWQITRAAQGNALSYGYAIEWPVFAAFVVAVWIVELRKAVRGESPEDQTVRAHEQGVRSERADEPQPVRRRRPRNEAAYDDSDDPQLAAYNHYLGWLNTHPHANPADYPGMPAADPAPVTTRESS